MGRMGDFRASEKDIRLTVSDAMRALLEEQKSGHELAINRYKHLKDLNWPHWDDEIREKAENGHSTELLGYATSLKELEVTQHKVTLALDKRSLSEARDALIEGGLLLTIYDGLSRLKIKIDTKRVVEGKTSLNDLDMQAVIDRFDKFRQGADDYANVVEWLKIVAVDKWLSGELGLHEQMRNNDSKKLPSKAKNIQGFSVSAGMILSGIWKACTGYKKFIDGLPAGDALQTLTQLSCLDSKATESAVNEVKAAYEKFRTYPARWEKNGSIDDATAEMHGDKELYDFIRTIAAHRFTEMKTAIRNAALSNNDQRKYHKYSSENYRYSSDDVAHAGTYAEGLMLEDVYALQETLDWLEGLEKAQPVESMKKKTPVNTVDLTMYSKKYVFENSGTLIFKDDFARRTDTIDAAVKAFREKYKENAGITIEEIDNKYSAQGGWGVAEFEQEVKLHIGSIILAVKSSLDDLRGTFICNGIDGEFIGKIRRNLEEDLDIPGEKENAVKYYLALKETQEWLDRDFCVHEVKQSTESDVTLPMVEKQKAKEAIEMVGVYVINKHEISSNLLLAIREFIEKRKTENQPIGTNRERLTGISGESWSHVFTEFKEKIDNASAFDLNALDLWGPIIKKAGYSTTDELFNQHATLINLFEFAAEEKMNEIRNQRNLTVEYIKQNTEKKTYGLEYDIAVDSFLALKAANDWLTELMRKKEEGSSTIESEKAVKQQFTIQTSNKNEANHPSSSINQKRIPDYKKNRSWTQFVHNKNILEEFEQICDKEGCTTKKQIVDEFWIVYGNELDGKKSGLYDACCNNEKANKFLEQVISEHKKAK